VSEAASGRSGQRAEHWLELVSTVLIAVAAVATAWSGYQSARWSGEQAKAYSRANATRLESTRASALANTQTQIDVATFTQWVDAFALDQKELADFYFARFRDEFRPAVDAWITTKPRQNPDAPLTPFAMPEYRLEASVEADRLEAAATAESEDASSFNQRSDNYVLAVVLFATSLFFAGISTRLPTTRSRAAILTLGCIVFVSTLAWVATFPVNVGV
jgi:ABC-type nickel/cobalt efflux system permease component RcnA